MSSYCLKCGENTKKHHSTGFKRYKWWNNNQNLLKNKKQMSY